MADATRKGIYSWNERVGMHGWTNNGSCLKLENCPLMFI